MAKTTQNELTDALTSAMSAIADSSVQSKDATLTIEAEVVEVIDEGLGTYKVKYLGNKFDATTAHTEIVYEVGDMVYVIIPNGDFDKNKIILSPVNSSSAVYASTQDETVYIALGDNLFKNIDNVSLCTYKPHSADDPESHVNIDTTGFSALFQASLDDSRVFNFTCKIQTNIEKDRRSKGNYGLILDIPVIQLIDGIEIQKYYSFVMDINNIMGDLYNLEVPALQNFYFSLPEDMVYNNVVEPRIRSFVYDFLGEDNTKPDDIFITDIKLLSILEIDKESMSGYYSVITASEGNSFLASRTGDIKTLSVTAYLNGKVTKINNFDCYWFKENAAIDTTNDKFQRFGGLGWEILNEVNEKSIAEDGKVTYQYVTNVYTQLISQSEIHYDTKFKCVLVKNDKVITSTIVIKNLASDAIIELTSINGSTTFSAGIGNIALQLKYYESGITDVEKPDFVIGYAWQRFDKKGNYIDNNFYTIDEFNKKENNTYYTKIHYPVNEVDEFNTIYCTVYIDTPSFDKTSVKRQIIGTTGITVTIGEASNGQIVITNGDKLYKYDADGDSPMVADYDGPLTSAIKIIDPISIRVYKEDGVELTDDEYKVTDINWLVPINSMIKLSNEQKSDTTTNPGYYTISGKYPVNHELNYNINNTYNKNKLDNAIIVQASAPSAVLKDTISNVANIKFLKDGEGGTNGSKYSAIITYKNYGYGEKDSNGKINKFQLIYVKDSNAWYIYNPAHPDIYTVFEPSIFRAELYVDGEKVTTPPSVDWGLFDTKFTFDDETIISPINIDNNGEITLNDKNWTDVTKNFCVTIEAKVAANTISTLTSLTNSEEYVYAYYPIECTYIKNYEYLKGFTPSMNGGFFKVLYASDGTNPQYDNSENFYIINPILGEDIEELYDYNWASSENLKIRDPMEQTCKVTPITKYDNGIAKNFVRADISRNSIKTQELIAEKEALENEKDSIENQINYYQILQDNLDIFRDFNYNSYINRLTEAAPLFLVKINLIKTVNELLDQINRLYFLTDQYKVTEDGSIDQKVENIYNEVIEKKDSLEDLKDLCIKISVLPDIIEEIINITPSVLNIINKIPDSDVSNRSCYFTINDNINIYNNIVNNVYSTYLDSLKKREIISYDAIVQSVINELNNFVTDTRLNNLTKEYYNCNDETYRYNALAEVLQGRMNSASIEENTCSYNLIIENILKPIYDTLNWYIDFYDNNGYEFLLEELTKRNNILTDEIEILNNMLLPGNSVYIIHVKPIIMIYNRYELSNINGWDGNKLETGDGYLIAPQVGAGKKMGDNSFTGIVMGVKQVQEKTSNNQKIGLFGYSSGVQSIFLNAEDGSASFGVSGAGQVIIEPSTNKAIIKSGNYNDNIYNRIYERKFSVEGNPQAQNLYEYDPIEDKYILTDDTFVVGGKAYYEGSNTKGGMLIDLTTPEIKFGSGNFEVNSDGHIIAKGGGEIAGWLIGNTELQSKNKTIALNSEGDGKIYSNNHTELSSVSKGFYLSNDGLSIHNGFRITVDSENNAKLEIGRLNSGNKYWTINGTTDRNSYIAYNATSLGFDFARNTINGNDKSVYLGTDGIRLGRFFAVDSNGNFSAKNGKITGTIEGSTLRGTMFLELENKYDPTLPNHRSTLNWGETWADSLTVHAYWDGAGIGTCYNKPIGTPGPDNPGILRTNWGVYLHWNDIEYYYEGNTGTPLYAQWTSNQEDSDKRLKENVRELSSDILQKFYKELNPIIFNYKKQVGIEGTFFGVFAQDMEKALKAINIDDSKIVYEVNGYKRLLYASTAGFQIAAAKDLYEKYNDMQEQINLLKQEINELKGGNNG